MESNQKYDAVGVIETLKFANGEIKLQYGSIIRISSASPNISTSRGTKAGDNIIKALEKYGLPQKEINPRFGAFGLTKYADGSYSFNYSSTYTVYCEFHTDEQGIIRKTSDFPIENPAPSGLLSIYPSVFHTNIAGTFGERAFRGGVRQASIFPEPSRR